MILCGAGRKEKSTVSSEWISSHVLWNEEQRFLGMRDQDDIQAIQTDRNSKP